ncbi:unnamed protein product [Callosobruchus maculatus]|uniref:Uncharacterized protein n=1 Tax=Callosobruchus maculatus TaxID=64391 RepID=A0A653C5X6_CALMS|nr:unnamed protein product [Callosobruchus maculatus]
MQASLQVNIPLCLLQCTFEELKKNLKEGGMYSYNIYSFIYFLLKFSLFHSMRKIMFLIAMCLILEKCSFFKITIKIFQG